MFWIGLQRTEYQEVESTLEKIEPRPIIHCVEYLRHLIRILSNVNSRIAGLCPIPFRYGGFSEVHDCHHEERNPAILQTLLNRRRSKLHVSVAPKVTQFRRAEGPLSLAREQQPRRKGSR